VPDNRVLHVWKKIYSSDLTLRYQACEVVSVAGADHLWSPLSRVYAQYHNSLRDAKRDYESRLRGCAEALNREWDRCLRRQVHSFRGEFSDPDFRSTKLRQWIEVFFGTTEVPFVAIDGSSHIEVGDRFISIYGGAYGSRGTVAVTGDGGRLKYKRWELSRDVSMVAFIPIPPEAGEAVVDAPPEVEAGSPAMSDREVAEFATMHNRVMQLAEVYLAYSLVGGSTLETPRLVLMDTTLSGWLANTSFSPRHLRVVGGRVRGIRLEKEHVYTVLAHPIEYAKEINADGSVDRIVKIPVASLFLPHYRLIAEAQVLGTTELVESKVSKEARGGVFRKGGEALQSLGLAECQGSRIRLSFDPLECWEDAVKAFERLSKELFIEKSHRGLLYRRRSSTEYLSPRDVQFFSGIGLRALIEKCWSEERRTLLVGIVKDSRSSYFFRNYLGSLHVLHGEDPGIHVTLPLSDRTALELLAQVRDELEAPWSTHEFDSAFMTLHPRRGSSGWEVGGYYHPQLKEYTRPPRIFLRSLAQFFLKPASKLSSHVIFIDRLAYRGWDDKDSEDVQIGGPGSGLGRLSVLRYTRPSRLHYVTMFMIGVLVRNHFPEAIGYPEPLHKADWGAKSMRDRVKDLLKSSWIVERSDPLHRTFRRIRDSLGR